MVHCGVGALDENASYLYCNSRSNVCTVHLRDCYEFPLTTHGSVVYNRKFIAILASILRSAAGPAFYAVTSSDLCPLNPENSMVKSADDTYLIARASICDGPCARIRTC